MKTKDRWRTSWSCSGSDLLIPCHIFLLATFLHMTDVYLFQGPATRFLAMSHWSSLKSTIVSVSGEDIVYPNFFYSLNSELFWIVEKFIEHNSIECRYSICGNYCSYNDIPLISSFDFPTWGNSLGDLVHIVSNRISHMNRPSKRHKNWIIQNGWTNLYLVMWVEMCYFERSIILPCTAWK